MQRREVLTTCFFEWCSLFLCAARKPPCELPVTSALELVHSWLSDSLCSQNSGEVDKGARKSPAKSSRGWVAQRRETSEVTRTCLHFFLTSTTTMPAVHQPPRRLSGSRTHTNKLASVPLLPLRWRDVTGFVCCCFLPNHLPCELRLRGALRVRTLPLPLSRCRRSDAPRPS